MGRSRETLALFPLEAGNFLLAPAKEFDGKATGIEDPFPSLVVASPTNSFRSCETARIGDPVLFRSCSEVTRIWEAFPFQFSTCRTSDSLEMSPMKTGIKCLRGISGHVNKSRFCAEQRTGSSRFRRKEGGP